MNPVKQVAKLIRRIDVVPDADRSRRALEEILDVQEKVKKTVSAGLQPDRGRIVMSNRMIKYVAAAVILAAGVGAMEILWNGGPAAHAFARTVEAMQGKRSFHIRTYRPAPEQLKDEFWAEFDENGGLLRYRQEDGPVVTVWEDNVRTRYYPESAGIRLITSVGNTEEEELEEFDPQLAVQHACEDVAGGKATVEVRGSSTEDNRIAIVITRADNLLRHILWIDPATSLVTRADVYWWTTDETTPSRRQRRGGWTYHVGIEVLEYNQLIDPNVFTLNPPDAITLDQVSQEVGMAQGEMTNEEVATALVRASLEAWAAGDYARAGTLFGGAPPELLTEHYARLRPVSVLSVGEPLPVPYRKPWFEVPCRYEVERDGRIETIGLTLNVLAVDGQPGRWYVSIEGNP
jgi:hypothetical protein